MLEAWETDVPWQFVPAKEKLKCSKTSILYSTRNEASICWAFWECYTNAPINNFLKIKICAFPRIDLHAFHLQTHDHNSTSHSRIPCACITECAQRKIAVNAVSLSIKVFVACHIFWEYILAEMNNHFLPTEVSELVEFLLARLECLLWGLRGLERKNEWTKIKEYGTKKMLILIACQKLILKRKPFD